MKLSAQEEYGLRCVLNLARLQPAPSGKVGGDSPRLGNPSASSPTGTNSSGTRSISVTRIAELEGLSTEYASKLMGILGKSGLVESVRGRNGGFRLARPADQISLAETLNALGEKLYEPETCERFRGDRRHCVHHGGCSIRSLWSGLQGMIDQVLGRATLGDLVRFTETGMATWLEDPESNASFTAAPGPATAPSLPTIRALPERG